MKVPKYRFMPTHEVAQRLNETKKGLARMRQRRRDGAVGLEAGPPYVGKGKHVRYKTEDFEAWYDALEPELGVVSNEGES